mmetsp:Transcript_28582/g.55761  ORF Transcript_28582/g.55761 Transcript_28582/m.55761 type:complete len:335 (-) Transcript_28582:264-1268(-)
MSYVSKAAPPIVAHRHRVDRMTATKDEAREDWGRGWMTTPDFTKSVANSRKNTAAKTMNLTEKMSVVTSPLAATAARSRRSKDLLAQTRVAEHAERTSTYCERSRFLCLGAPLQSAGEREALRSRMQTSQSRSQMDLARLPTPVTESFHFNERPGRAQSVLKRHRTAKPVKMYGMRTEFQETTRNLTQSGKGRIDVCGFGSGTKVVQTNENPTDLDRTLLSDTLSSQFFNTTQLDSERENARRRPLSAYSTIPFKGQIIMISRTANQPSEKRVFLNASRGVLFDPEASMRPPVARLSTAPSQPRSRPPSRIESPLNSPASKRPHTRAGAQSSLW